MTIKDDPILLQLQAGMDLAMRAHWLSDGGFKEFSANHDAAVEMRIAELTSREGPLPVACCNGSDSECNGCQSEPHELDAVG